MSLLAQGNKELELDLKNKQTIMKTNNQQQIVPYHPKSYLIYKMNHVFK
jgi:hypothetical protein